MKLSLVACCDCHLFLLQVFALCHCGGAQGSCYPQEPYLQPCLLFWRQWLNHSEIHFCTTRGDQEPFLTPEPSFTTQLSCHWGKKAQGGRLQPAKGIQCYLSVRTGSS